MIAFAALRTAWLLGKELEEGIREQGRLQVLVSRTDQHFSNQGGPLVLVFG